MNNRRRWARLAAWIGVLSMAGCAAGGGFEDRESEPVAEGESTLEDNLSEADELALEQEEEDELGDEISYEDGRLTISLEADPAGEPEGGCDFPRTMNVSPNGGDQIDVLWGGIGNDTMEGGGGDDIMHGEAGLDTLLGESGDDEMNGDGDNDTLRGGSGNDDMSGGLGDDLLDGGGQADVLHGNDGADVLCGRAGGDDLWGDAGEDRICGHGGSDDIFGGADYDRCNGGTGQPWWWTNPCETLISNTTCANLCQ